MADPELTKAFSELQTKILDMNQKVKVSEGQIAFLKMQITRCDLTNKELTELPKETNTYQSAGRMFILESTTDICKGLDSRKIQSKDKIKTIEGQISYWKKGVKETEENIRDMVSQRRDK